jgi:WhiB family redox-sensing transcriptional regulator
LSIFELLRKLRHYLFAEYPNRVNNEDNMGFVPQHYSGEDFEMRTTPPEVPPGAERVISEKERALQAYRATRNPEDPTGVEQAFQEQEEVTVDGSQDRHDERGWEDFANCLGVDPDLFFPERGASTREAKEVCRGCPVREDCLEYALGNAEKFGIWGGMSERERRRIRRQRALARGSQVVTIAQKTEG